MYQSEVSGTSKWPSIICLYLAQFTVSFILIHLPVACVEKPADSMLPSQPFFKVMLVISCNFLLADTELNIMADKFKYSFNQCIQSFVFCSQSFTGHIATSRLLLQFSLFCQTTIIITSSKTSHHRCFITEVLTFMISSNQSLYCFAAQVVGQQSL